MIGTKIVSRGIKLNNEKGFMHYFIGLWIIQILSIFSYIFHFFHDPRLSLHLDRFNPGYFLITSFQDGFIFDFSIKPVTIIFLSFLIPLGISAIIALIQTALFVFIFINAI